MQSPHKQRVCRFGHVTAGCKIVEGISWWPGYLPFTIDGSTLNTARVQTASFTPYSASKYLTYIYEAQVDNEYTDNTGVQTMHAFFRYEFVFDAEYGDLVSAAAEQTYTVNGVTQFGSFDRTWNRSDGYLSDSDLGAGGFGPDDVPWPSLSGSDVIIACTAIHDPTRQAGIPYTGIVPLDPTELSYSDSGTYTPPPGTGALADGTYSVSVEVTLGSEITITNRAEQAKTLSEAAGLSTSDWTTDMLWMGASGVDSLDRWRDPDTYEASAVFSFTEYADDLVTAGDDDDATNRIAVCYNRYKEGIVFAHKGIQDPEYMVVAYGVPNDEYAFQAYPFGPVFAFTAPGDWWDEPQVTLAVRSTRSIVNLEIGLECGNPDDYDYEKILTQDSDGTIGAVSIGDSHIASGVRAYTIENLQTYLAAQSRTFGSGWIGTSISGQPSCA